MALLITSLLYASTVDAADDRVMLLPAAADDPLLMDVANRIAAELRAGGFVVTERRADDQPALAEVQVTRQSDGAGVIIDIADRVSRKSVSRRIDWDQNTTPAIVAIRAMELLRASFLELVVDPRSSKSKTTAVPDAVRQWVDVQVPQNLDLPHTLASRPALGFAITALSGVTSTLGGAAIAPQLVLSFPLFDRWAAAAAFAGPTYGQTVQGADGKARVRQLLAWIELMHARPLSHRWSWAATAGLGAHLLSSEGDAFAPAVGKTSSRAGGIGIAGLSVAYRVRRIGFVAADVRAVVWAPPVGVRFAGQEIARTAQPTLMTCLGFRTSW